MIAVDRKLINVNRKLIDVDRKLIDVDRKLIDIDRKLIDVDRKLIDIDRKLIAVDRKLIAVNRKLIDGDQKSIPFNQRSIDGDQKLIPFNQRSIEADSPGVVCFWLFLMEDIVEARYVSGYTIWLRFEDGTEGEVDLSSELNGPVLRETISTVDMHDQAKFACDVSRLIYCYECSSSPPRDTVRLAKAE